jgi:single-strand DNA-binding protein
MSKDLNKCQFIGRLGKDPETRYLPNGNACTNITLAVGDDYKDKNTGQKVEQTEWVRITAFGRQAEVLAEYTKKGSKIYVEGKFKTRKWEKDGVMNYSTEINLENMQLLDGKPAQGNPGSASQPAAHKGAAPDMDSFDDDIPF